MKLKRLAGFMLMMFLLVFLAASCASNRPPYKHHKPRRSSGCDCSRWSYIVPENIQYFYAGPTNPPGRA